MAPRPERKLEFTRSTAMAVATGAALGALEGAVYPADAGPRIALPIYWGLLAFLLWRLQVGRYSLAVLPLALVVQDALSLILQGASPLTADWYAAVFGRNWLTARDAWLPNWYWAGVALTLVLASGIAAWDAARAALAARARKRRRAARAK